MDGGTVVEEYGGKVTASEGGGLAIMVGEEKKKIERRQKRTAAEGAGKDNGSRGKDRKGRRSWSGQRTKGEVRKERNRKNEPSNRLILT